MAAGLAQWHDLPPAVDIPLALGFTHAIAQDIWCVSDDGGLLDGHYIIIFSNLRENAFILVQEDTRCVFSVEVRQPVSTIWANTFQGLLDENFFPDVIVENGQMKLGRNIRHISNVDYFQNVHDWRIHKSGPFGLYRLVPRNEEEWELDEFRKPCKLKAEMFADLDISSVPHWQDMPGSFELYVVSVALCGDGLNLVIVVEADDDDDYRLCLLGPSSPNNRYGQLMSQLNRGTCKYVPDVHKLFGDWVLRITFIANNGTNPFAFNTKGELLLTKAPFYGKKIAHMLLG